MPVLHASTQVLTNSLAQHLMHACRHRPPRPAITPCFTPKTTPPGCGWLQMHLLQSRPAWLVQDTAPGSGPLHLTCCQWGFGVCRVTRLVMQPRAAPVAVW
jgi:hypothetical protein